MHLKPRHKHIINNISDIGYVHIAQASFSPLRGSIPQTHSEQDEQVRFWEEAANRFTFGESRPHKGLRLEEEFHKTEKD